MSSSGLWSGSKQISMLFEDEDSPPSSPTASPASTSPPKSPMRLPQKRAPASQRKEIRSWLRKNVNYSEDYSWKEKADAAAARGECNLSKVAL